MLRGSNGAISSVIQAALRAPPARPARISREIISEVVEVMMKRPTDEPGATDSSSRLSVPCTLTATKALRSWVATLGLCSAPAWMTAPMPKSRIVARTRLRSTIEPTTRVVAAGTGSRPTTSWPLAASNGTRVRPSQPDDPVTRMRVSFTG